MAQKSRSYCWFHPVGYPLLHKIRLAMAYIGHQGAHLLETAACGLHNILVSPCIKLPLLPPMQSLMGDQVSVQ